MRVDREMVSRTLAIHVAGLAIVAALGAGAYVLGVQPVALAKERAALLSAELAERSAEESELRKRQREAEARLRDARERLARNAIELRPASGLNEQVAAITALASEIGVRVDAISPSAAVQDDGFVRIPVRVTGHASSSAVVRLMSMLRERFSDVTVRTFDIRSDIASTEPTTTVQMELEWHALRPAR